MDSQLPRPSGGLPNFLVIGATKCGTESLHRYLSDHPQVFIHPKKELRFFTEEHNWKRGVDWYRTQFSAAASARAVGEATNWYTRHPVFRGVPERIHGLLPDVRMLYLIRHPIERIESHYRHRLVMGREWREPEEALREEPAYIAASRYGSQLEQYVRYFPPEQILTVRLEHLLSNPEATLRRLCRFLDIDETPGARFPKVNVTAERTAAPRLLRRFSRFPAAKPYVQRANRQLRRAGLGGSRWADEPSFVMSPQTHDELAATFREDLARLSQILGEPFDDWDLEARPPGGSGAGR